MSKHANAVSNPELKAKLEAIRLRDQPELESEAYELLTNGAHLLSAVHPKEQAGNDVKYTAKYDFPVLTSSVHGHIFYPVFTDLEELRKWKEEEASEVLVLTFDDYVELLEQDSRAQGLVINPFGANYSIERDMVEFLSAQKAFVGKLAIEQMFQQKAEAESDGGVRLSDPEPYPAELVQAMAGYMATNNTIRRAWLRWMENEGDASYLVIIDAAQSDTHGDFGEVSSAAMPYLNGSYLDLMTLEDDFSKKAVSGVKPFYEKA